MSAGQQQQTIYTIHESQLNNNNSAGGSMIGAQGPNNGHRNSDVLIDTSSIPLTHQAPLPPMQQHQHLQPTGASGGKQQQFDNQTITSQPPGGGGGGGGGGGQSRIAPESQAVVYSVHPVFGELEGHEALLVRQRADCTSTCCGFESVNTYTVRAEDGTPLLRAEENSNCCERCCCETNREYDLTLKPYGRDEVVARIRKPYRISRLCCYTNAARIESPEDNPIGLIRQLFTLFGHPRYAIYDCQQPPKTPSFYLESVSCRFCCTPLLCTCICGNREFRIISAETGEPVGSISRRWTGGGGGGAPNSAPDADEQANGSTSPVEGREDAFGQAGQGSQLFGVQFEPGLEARHKLLLLSACFMMDFFYFENDRRRRKLASC